jgi:hypothetical protein
LGCTVWQPTQVRWGICFCFLRVFFATGYGIMFCSRFSSMSNN